MVRSRYPESVVDLSAEATYGADQAFRVCGEMARGLLAIGAAFGIGVDRVRGAVAHVGCGRSESAVRYVVGDFRRWSDEVSGGSFVGEIRAGA